MEIKIENWDEKRFALEAANDHPSWATRIPAAIKQAEELLLDAGERDYFWLLKPRSVITATEVALAEALWAWIAEPGETPAALIAFTEKVEALDG